MKQLQATLFGGLLLSFGRYSRALFARRVRRVFPALAFSFGRGPSGVRLLHARVPFGGRGGGQTRGALGGGERGGQRRDLRVLVLQNEQHLQWGGD